jgi:quercetin dioxygenase-like cupin family protein
MPKPLAFAPNTGSKSLHPGGAVAFNVLTKALTKGSHGFVVADGVVGSAPPYHKHACDETFIILEGVYELISEGEAWRVGPGCVAYVPGGAPHTIRCVEAGPRGVGKSAVVIVPAGLEGFFDEVEEYRQRGQQLTHADLARIAQPYGVEFLGPTPEIRTRHVVG